MELTTLKQKLVRKKNRKLRRLRELYPDVKIKLFYARDFRMLLLKFGRMALIDELTGTTGQSTPPRVAAAPIPLTRRSRHPSPTRRASSGTGTPCRCRPVPLPPCPPRARAPAAVAAAGAGVDRRFDPGSTAERDRRRGAIISPVTLTRRQRRATP